MGEQHALLKQLIILERSLLDPLVRGDPFALQTLLHRDFLEIGRSGRFYDREEVLTALAAEPLPSDQIDIRETRLLYLGHGCCALVYLAVGAKGGALTRRTSIWRETTEGWQMMFHQGTPCP
ncbi:MAG: DUF4440 domain-containing protein [Bosea sp. (in: a-proteobacteria)]